MKTGDTGKQFVFENGAKVVIVKRDSLAYANKTTPNSIYGWKSETGLPQGERSLIDTEVDCPEKHRVLKGIDREGFIKYLLQEKTA